MTAGHLVLLLLSSLFSLGNEITGDDDEKETDETKRRVHLVGGLSLRIERREAPEISGRNFQMDSLKKNYVHSGFEIPKISLESILRSHIEQSKGELKDLVESSRNPLETQ